MIYIFNMRYLSIGNIILLLIVLLIVFLSIVSKRRLKKYNNYMVNEHTNFQKKIILFMGVLLSIILSFVNLCSIVEKIYAINCYNNKQYCVVEGEIENFKYIYANNSTNVIGIQFMVNKKNFKINKGILNVGYSVKNNIINGNGEKYKIYYLDNGEKFYLDTILRIDELDTGGLH